MCGISTTYQGQLEKFVLANKWMSRASREWKYN